MGGGGAVSEKVGSLGGQEVGGGRRPTFVHPVQDGLQHVLAVAVAVLLPHGAVLAAQHHQLAVAVAQRGEVRDLHDDRPVNQQHITSIRRNTSSECIIIKVNRFILIDIV